MVNNAGIFCGQNRIAEESVEAFDKTMVSCVVPVLESSARASSLIEFAGSQHSRSIPGHEIRYCANDEAGTLIKWRSRLDCKRLLHRWHGRIVDGTYVGSNISLLTSEILTFVR